MKIESDGKLSMGIKGKIQIIISDNDPWIMHIATHGAKMEKDNVIRRNLANNHYISKEGICIRSLYEIMKSMGAYNSNCDESDKLK